METRECKNYIILFSVCFFLIGLITGGLIVWSWHYRHAPIPLSSQEAMDWMTRERMEQMNDDKTAS